MSVLGNLSDNDNKISFLGDPVNKDPSASEEKTPSMIAELIESFITSLILLMVIYVFIAFPEVVSGASMEPTLMDGERILVEKVTRHFDPYARGDIIIFHPPGKDDVDYVKRIIGLPGDVVKVSDCNVYVTSNGERFIMEEPYLYENTCTKGNSEAREGRALKLEDNEYFVLGDNRTKSADSRVLGPITGDRLVGKVILRFWPISKTGLL